MPELTPVDLDGVRRLADRAGLPAPTSHAPLAGGYANTSYRVEFTDHPPLVLTIVNDKPAAQARAALDLQSRIARETEVPVPVVRHRLPLEPGEVPVGTDGRAPELALWKGWIVGRVPKVLTADRLAEIGRALAALHMLPESSAPDALPKALDYGPPVWREAETWEERHAEFAQWIAEWRARAIATGVETFPRAILHFDIDADNTVFSGTEPDRLVAVLDWEEACVDARIWDLASTLCFAHRQTDGWSPELRDALLDGYLAGGGGLVDEEFRALRTLTGAAAAAHAFWHYRHGPVRRGLTDSEPARDRQTLADRILGAT